MAQVVVVQPGDSISRILTQKMGVGFHELASWLAKARDLNPHIGDLERIWPGDRILIPDQLVEPIEEQQIWQNAMSRIPMALMRPWRGHTELYLTGCGDTIDAIAEKMFAESPYRNLPASTKRAVFLSNNMQLKRHLHQAKLPPKLLLVVIPALLSRHETHFWEGERPVFRSFLQQLGPTTSDMYQETGPENTYIMARIAEALQSAGASVGSDDVVRGLGYGVGGVSGVAASGDIAVSRINSLLNDIYGDAVKRFGQKVVVSTKTSQLARMGAFIRAHPKYGQLIRHLQELPDFLLPLPRHKLMPPSHSKGNTLARHFRKQYWRAFQRTSSSRYMGTIARQLDGRVALFKGLGRGATWYVPSVLGLVSVAQAPPELRMRTLFSEGFGIVGGYAGTELGMLLGFGIVAALGLGPFGLFVAVFICSTAGGILGYEGSKWFSGRIYDVGNKLDGRFLYSPNEFFELLK